MKKLWNVGITEFETKRTRFLVLTEEWFYPALICNVIQVKASLTKNFNKAWLFQSPVIVPTRTYGILYSPWMVNYIKTFWLLIFCNTFR